MKATVLTAGLLSDLQEYLQLNGEKMWRIRIPIYFKADDPHRVIVVYSDTLDIPSLYPGVTAVIATNARDSAVKHDLR
jgi:hypothetical protein